MLQLVERSTPLGSPHGREKLLKLDHGVTVSLQVFGAQVHGDVRCELSVAEKKLPPDVIDEMEPVNGVRCTEGVSVLSVKFHKGVFVLI